MFSRATDLAAAMTFELLPGPRRVVVSDADARLRSAMAAILEAAGYHVLQVDDLASVSPTDLHADFAVMRYLAVGGELTGSGRGADAVSHELAVGWLRTEGRQDATPGAVAEVQRQEHAIRIFSAIAPLFIDVDREGAERLTRGIHALRSTVWGPTSAARDRAQARGQSDT